MAEGVNGEVPVHGRSICVVAVYMYILLTNEFRRMSTVKTPEQRGAILEDQHGGGTRHVTECTEGAVITSYAHYYNCHIMLTTCTKLHTVRPIGPISFVQLHASISSH